MNKRISFDRGFTLIELLVVVAIIGILSSVVLAYLSDSRVKGKNAKAKSEMTSLRNQAEIYHNEYHLNVNGYGIVGSTTHANGGVVPSGPPFTGMCLDANIILLTKDIAANLNTDFFCQGGTGGNSYVMYTSLINSAPNTSICMDSVGNLEEVPTSGIITSGSVRCK